MVNGKMLLSSDLVSPHYILTWHTFPPYSDHSPPQPRVCIVMMRHWLECAASCNDLMIYFRKHRLCLSIIDTVMMMMCWTTWNIKTVAPNAPPCLAPSGIETFDYWIHDIPDYIENIENSLNGWWHLSNFCVSHRSAADMPCFAGDQGGPGSCYKSANYIETPR